MLGMTELLEHAVAKLRNLSPDLQDDFARLVLGAIGIEQPLIQLSVEDEASFTQSLAQEDCGEFASNADIRAIWAKHGL